MPRRRMTFIAIVAGLFLAGLVAILRAPERTLPSSRPLGRSGSRQGVVTYVYDGDTIEVSGVGKVRLIGIDAFDAHNVQKAADQARRYGLTARQVRDLAAEGTRKAIDALKGRTVTLESGYETRDGYGRVLAYVRVKGDDGVAYDFDLAMIQSGLAAAFRSFDHPRLDAYLAAEDRARKARRGMWADARLRP